MNIVEFTDKFLDIEERYDLFSIIDDNSLEYWDLVRFDVFYAIYFDITNEKNVEASVARNNLIVDLFWGIFYFVKYFFYIKFKKCKYLCFVCSRYKSEFGLNNDIASNDVVDCVLNDSILFESFRTNGKYKYPHIFNIGLKIEELKKVVFNKLKTKSSKKSFSVSNILLNEFNLKGLDLDVIIDRSIEKYKLEFSFYKKLFKKLHPKGVFVVQNGIQKGMFAAANDLDIPLIELQHGLIGYIHPAYSYPNYIKKCQIKSLPRYFISFSPFWTKNINYPVKQIVPMGNSFFSKKNIKKEVVYDITMIFADIYNKILINLLDELIANGFKRQICIKLHPNQFYQKDEIAEHFKSYNFVSVVSNEKNIEDLMSISKSILAIQSTCVYQALHNNVMVLLYKRMDYHTHSDVFSNPMVKLVDRVGDIKSLFDDNLNLNLNLNLNSNMECTFDDFNEELFLKFIKQF